MFDLETLLDETMISELKELQRLQRIREEHVAQLPRRRPLRMLAINWRIRKACRRINLLRSTY